MKNKKMPFSLIGALLSIAFNFLLFKLADTYQWSFNTQLIIFPILMPLALFGFMYGVAYWQQRSDKKKL
ncbi:hypothetical protein [Lacticaseibacillus saniviri]